MVTIKDSSLLDITFDTLSNTISYGNGIGPKSTQKISLNKLVPVLLNKSLNYPEFVYEEHIQVLYDQDRDLETKGLSFDLLTLPSGLLGVEFIKSHVYYTPVDDATAQFSCVVEALVGVLTIIMQKNKPKEELDFHTYVETGLIVKLKPGEKLAVPKGYFYTFINTEETPILFVRLYKNSGQFDYSVLKKERGLAYYCIRKNAREEIVLNPLYREVPQIKEIPANSFIDDLGLECTCGLYSQLRSHLDDLVSSLWG